jgi:hypothetical protein
MRNRLDPTTTFHCGSQRITCHIKHVAIADNPIYDALSYTWGDTSLLSTIICDGAPLQISSNLHLAQNRFQHEGTSLLLWADTIFINQCDSKERNSQVLLMRQIYQNAWRVRIWLGEETEGSKLAFASSQIANCRRRYAQCYRYATVGLQATLRRKEQTL